jgi:calcineurin-like phosphoesterase
MAGFVVAPGTTYSADAVIPGTGNWDSASGSTPEEALARLEAHLQEDEQ